MEIPAFLTIVTLSIGGIKEIEGRVVLPRLGEFLDKMLVLRFNSSSAELKCMYDIRQDGRSRHNYFNTMKD